MKQTAEKQKKCQCPATISFDNKLILMRYGMIGGAIFAAFLAIIIAIFTSIAGAERGSGRSPVFAEVMFWQKSDSDSDKDGNNRIPDSPPVVFREKQ